MTNRIYLEPAYDENGKPVVPPPPPGYVVRTWPEEGEQWYAEKLGAKPEVPSTDTTSNPTRPEKEKVVPKGPKKFLYRLPPRQPGEPPRTHIDYTQMPSRISVPVTSYYFDEDGVHMRIERDEEGRPCYPVVPPGYGAPVWSDLENEWYAIKLSKRYSTRRNTVALYSPNGINLVVPKYLLDACLHGQKGRCCVTGRKFNRNRKPGLIRVNVKEDITRENIVAVEKWMLEGEDPVNFFLLLEQWNARLDARKSGNETPRTKSLPF